MGIWAIAKILKTAGDAPRTMGLEAGLGGGLVLQLCVHSGMEVSQSKDKGGVCKTDCTCAMHSDMEGTWRYTGRVVGVNRQKCNSGLVCL